MNTGHLQSIVAVLSVALVPVMFGAVAKSDVATPEARHVTVELAAKLAGDLIDRPAGRERRDNCDGPVWFELRAGRNGQNRGSRNHGEEHRQVR